jgi:hypothetical protein
MPARDVTDDHSPNGLEPVSTGDSLAPRVETAMGILGVVGSSFVGTSLTGAFSEPGFSNHPKIFLVLGKISLDVLGSGWTAGEETASTPDVALPTS